MGAGVMAKKPELKLSTVKIEATVLRKAKTVADRHGLPVSTYISQVLGQAVEKDLDLIYKKAMKEGGAK